MDHRNASLEDLSSNYSATISLLKSFMLEVILTNETLMKQQDYSHFLIHPFLTETVGQSTKWRAVFDRLTFKYFSASIIRAGPSVGKLSQDIHVKEDPEDMLELNSVIMRGGKGKDHLRITQPLSFMNLTSIEVLDICNSDSTEKMLISDRKNIYLIDVTH